MNTGSGVMLEGGPHDGMIHEFVGVSDLGFPAAVGLPVDWNKPNGAKAWYECLSGRYIYSQKMTDDMNRKAKK